MLKLTRKTALSSIYRDWNPAAHQRNFKFYPGHFGHNCRLARSRLRPCPSACGRRRRRRRRRRDPRYLIKLGGTKTVCQKCPLGGNVGGMQTRQPPSVPPSSASVRPSRPTFYLPRVKNPAVSSNSRRCSCNFWVWESGFVKIAKQTDLQ